MAHVDDRHKSSSKQRDHQKGSAFEALFDSGYNSTTVSKTSIDLFDEFDHKVSIQSPNSDASTDEPKQWTDSGVCITDLGDENDINDDNDASDVSARHKLLSREDVIHESSKSTAQYVRQAFERDVDGDTLLHLAVIQGSHDVSRILIHIVPHPDFLDIVNHLSQTPLHLAALTRQPNIVRRLVVCGATIDLRDRHGNTPLHISCRLSDLASVRALVSPINDKEVRDALIVNYPIGVQCLPTDLLQLRNYEGETCIHLAAYNTNKKIIEFLVQSGADIDVQDGKSGKSALHRAVEMQKLDLLQFLVRRCRANVNVKSYAGHSPLYLAWTLTKVNPNNSKLRSIVQFLRDNGGEPALPPNDSDSDNDLSDEE